jgi:hypothetical protein
MQINLKFMKVDNVDRGHINFGPSIQTVIRSKARLNYGYGQVLGDDNEILHTTSEIDDRDVLDFPYKKIVIHK